MSKKILIVGGVAGGASVAARCRRHSETDQIIMFERGPHVSFSNCSLPYHLSNIVPNSSALVLMSPEKFAYQYNIDARINSEVLSIDRSAKTLNIKNTATGEQYTESYDKLILSPGAKPIFPQIAGIDKVNTFSIRNVVDIERLKAHIEKKHVRRISVIGGGFIGVECAENLTEAGYDVTLIEATAQIMKPFDHEMVQILHKEMQSQGVNLIVNDRVEAFTTNKILLSSGKCIDADAVVLAIGVLPETELALQAGLEIGQSGAMKVNQNYQTNDADIYAVGDVIEVYNSLLHTYFKLPLAGPAQKQARSVADHINGMRVNNRGYIGSSVIKVFDYNAASTGLNEAMIEASDSNIDHATVNLIANDKVGLMPDAELIHFKLLYELPTGRILGAQAIGKGNVDKRIDVIATVIKFSGTLEDLKDLELCYAPPFGTAKDVVNFAGYIGSNLLNSDYKQVNVTAVRALVEADACIVDVRETRELEAGHIKGSINIPLSELRLRCDELPTDVPLYIHCRSGQRSYNAVLALQKMGFKDVYNMSAGFMGLCFYEYFTDKTLGRTPIVTQYNFN
ncbi:pyridine nucleotide-disulfide oxidoreductase family protein [Psychromonas sp. CNPT3]|uniref:FAD-dependent oxidoreductase n=1 Tax=Psychromonas sp. CNPT3 TaxID=314282 RepID=UPI00006E85CF|nr:FAD-dependent oxidoreductase [Psychromonas sp. CNPT3]AGH81422.1 pyridine nucleotide-disulfide oxidoreductase family protein [Psychromonas sp. CNPT3]